MNGKVINLLPRIEQINDLAEWCDLLTKDRLSSDVPRCYGYPDECDICDVKKYRVKQS
jgi:hypothetical protein